MKESLPLKPKTRDEIKRLVEVNSCVAAMKDRNSVFIHSNIHYADLVGLKHSQEFIGRTDFDLPCASARFAPLFQCQDQKVMESGTSMHILDVHPMNFGEWKAYRVSKSCFIDEHGSIEGTFFIGEDVTCRAALNFSVLLDHASPNTKESEILGQFSHVLGSIAKPMLTERQEKILFFLIRRHTLKKIAVALTISLRTVYGEIEKLRIYFKAANTSELIDKAMASGYLSVIPTGLSWCQMSFVLQED